MTSFLGNNSLHTFLSSSKLPNSQNSKCLRYKVTYASLPARDKTIDFGKYKGRMLGTLPSTYLKWVSSNLRARDFEEWAQLADQVLEDPVYKDRMEWESAQKLLNGDVLNVNSKPEGVVAELLEVSQRFGWDNEDKVGWSKIDFQLLGTSKGGRIPRVKEKRGEELASMKRVEVEERERWRDERSEGGSGKVGVRERRDERRDRLRMKRGMLNMNKNNRFGNAVEEENEGNKYRRNKESSDSNGADVYSPFPGRETLLNKVLNRRRVV
ncbi:uncharacterized protein LOC104907276 [Beta vulgaris subsp. vulgaris]|uniref:uncharacterized protein LOC104907276 n=1 Tax=Beta vulgaris subsp. vulgaris TaxID=3555 RepID=UPI002036C280|nr:uncharacterized protein LOC104907276 [Beta vulgaris subsp. vulgaris]